MTLRILLFAIAAPLLHAAGPQQLFNGKDTTGWVMTGPGGFVVEGGLLKTEGGMGLFYYEREKFGNATIKVVFKTASKRANSGLIIRLPEKPLDPWYGVHYGYEVQIDSSGDEWHCTGSIYSISKVSDTTQQKPNGEWNVMEVDLKGQLTIIRLNGKEVNRFPSSNPVPAREKWYEPVRGPRPDSGYIGLQNHDTASIVYFKEISVTKH